MSKRRLVLKSETLTVLDSDQLSAVAAGVITKGNHALCVATNPQYSCPTCGIACTVHCTNDCG